MWRVQVTMLKIIRPEKKKEENLGNYRLMEKDLLLASRWMYKLQYSLTPLIPGNSVALFVCSLLHDLQNVSCKV